MVAAPFPPALRPGWARVALLGAALLAPQVVPAQDAGALPVTIATAHFGPVTVSATLTGLTEAAETADIAFRDGGRVTELSVDVGQRVTRGQDLGRIDATQAQEALREAQAQRAAAAANLARAEQEYTRQGALYDRGVTTSATLDAAREAFRTAQSAADQAQAALEQARITLVETRLTAPFDGTITARSADPGQIVGAASPVLEIAADTGTVALFYVPEGYVDEAVHNKDLTLSLLDTPEEEITGAVYEVSPMVDPTNGSVAVRVRLDAGTRRLPLGAAINGTVLFDVPDTAALPWEVLTADAGGPAVWVLGPDGTATLAQVTIERYETDRILVSGGVAEGAQVIARGSHLVYPGRPLDVVGEDPVSHPSAEDR